MGARKRRRTSATVQCYDPAKGIYMNRNRMLRNLCAAGVMLLASAPWALAQAPRQPPTPAQSIVGNFNGVNRQLLEMAKDFPEDKYGYRPKPEMRSFGEVLLHVMAGNTYAAKMGRGEKANWEAEEVDPKKYHGKAEIVAAFQQSVDDATAALKAIPPEQFTKSVMPWI